MSKNNNLCWHKKGYTYIYICFCTCTHAHMHTYNYAASYRRRYYHGKWIVKSHIYAVIFDLKSFMRQRVISVWKCAKAKPVLDLLLLNKPQWQHRKSRKHRNMFYVNRHVKLYLHSWLYIFKAYVRRDYNGNFKY